MSKSPRNDASANFLNEFESIGVQSSPVNTSSNQELNKAVKAALRNYRFNATMRDYLLSECRRYGLFDKEGKPASGALENCSSMVRLWYDRYNTLTGHLEYIENAFNILCAAYDTDDSTPTERMMCSIIRRTYFDKKKHTPSQLCSELLVNGSPISSTHFYRLLNRGTKILCNILVDPNPSWGKEIFAEEWE